MISVKMERSLCMYSRLWGIGAQFDKLMVVEVYLRYCQTSTMEHVAKIVNGF